MPDIDYKPLDRTEPEIKEVVVETPQEEQVPVAETQTFQFAQEPETPRPPTNYDEEDEEPASSKAPLIIGIVIVLVVVAAGFLIWKYWYVPRAEKAKLELARVQEAERLEKEKQAHDSPARLIGAYFLKVIALAKERRK